MGERVDGWEARISEVFYAYKSKPFAWGVSDCLHFADDCVTAITGEGFVGVQRGSYDNSLSAWSRLRALKFRNLEHGLEERMAAKGWAEGVPECSMVGDIGITLDGIVCVRFPSGFMARDKHGQFYTAKVERSWCVAWPGA